MIKHKLNFKSNSNSFIWFKNGGDYINRLNRKPIFNLSSTNLFSNKSNALNYKFKKKTWLKPTSFSKPIYYFFRRISCCNLRFYKPYFANKTYSFI